MGREGERCEQEGSYMENQVIILQDKNKDYVNKWRYSLRCEVLVTVILLKEDFRNIFFLSVLVGDCSLQLILQKLQCQKDCQFRNAASIFWVVRVQTSGNFPFPSVVKMFSRENLTVAANGGHRKPRKQSGNIGKLGENVCVLTQGLDQGNHMWTLGCKAVMGGGCHHYCYLLSLERESFLVGHLIGLFVSYG